MLLGFLLSTLLGTSESPPYLDEALQDMFAPTPEDTARDNQRSDIAPQDITVMRTYMQTLWKAVNRLRNKATALMNPRSPYTTETAGKHVWDTLYGAEYDLKLLDEKLKHLQRRLANPEEDDEALSTAEALTRIQQHAINIAKKLQKLERQINEALNILAEPEG